MTRTIDPIRREYLMAKYIAELPAAETNSTVESVLDGEYIMARSTRQGVDNSLLFDPTRSPEMYAIADQTMRDLRSARASGLRYVTPSGGRYNPDRVSDDRVLFVHFVGEKLLFACCGRDGADSFSDLLYASAWLWRKDECNMRITDDCGDCTIFLPLLRGQFLLMFECCMPCVDKAVDMATTAMLVSETAARARVGLPL